MSYLRRNGSLLVAGALLLVLLNLGWRAGAGAPVRLLPGPASAAPPPHAPAPGLAVPVAGPADEPPGEWRRPAKDYANTRYSPLHQINGQNVGQLKVAWTFSLGVLRGQESAPLVVNGTMYVVTPYPNYLYALDLSQPGAALKWVYKPKPNAASQGVACCDVVNRGPAYADGKIILNTLDAQTVAVDAATGREVWRTPLGNINSGESITMAPFVVKDRVLVGNSGGEFGVRGWLTALDLKTGKMAWRAYSTGPDKDVLIGSRFKPFYANHKEPDLGVKTWPPGAWQQGGGAVWGWISYDPESNLIYYGTSNPGPWNPAQRPGDNKWTSTIFARDVTTGEAVWAYQMSPHDLHDYDGINEMVLLDVPWKGQVRKALIHPDRNGYVYLVDRTSGEVLSAEAFVYINSSHGVDLKTGLLQYNPEKEPKVKETVRNICPNSPGGKDWQPSAFSPRTGLFYIPHQNLCMDVEAQTANYIAGTPYVGMTVKMTPGQGGHRVSSPPGTPWPRSPRGSSRSDSPCGATRWPPAATWCSTARWRAGSRRSTRGRARSCGGSRRAPASWASR